MTDLLTLIKKLVKQVPSRINTCLFDDDTSVEYFYSNVRYTIRYWNCDSQYNIQLTISEADPYRLLNVFYVEVSEKDYMEIKWKCEEWNNYLKEQQLNRFEEFVEGFSNDSMDNLLND